MYLISFKWVKARCEEQREIAMATYWYFRYKNLCIYTNGSTQCCEKDCELLKGVTKYGNSRNRVSR
jgi:hypothetical protein